MVAEPVRAEPAAADRGPPGPGLVSVIVPHLNDYDNLDACLTLMAREFPQRPHRNHCRRQWQFARVDACARSLEPGPRIEVAERGAGPARNAGVRASSGEAIAFIDSDCRPDERWLEEGLAELAMADFVGGRVDVLVEDPRRMTPAEAFESVFAFRNERYVKDLGFTVTASMFVWRSVFDAVGGFKNGVPEDKDWGERAQRLGFRIRFAAKSIVGHPARRTMPELKRKWRRLTLESCEGARAAARAPPASCCANGRPCSRSRHTRSWRWARDA